MAADLFLELHTDGVGFLEEDGVPPEQVPQGGELIETPLTERPQSQLGLSRGPGNCGTRVPLLSAILSSSLFI